MANQPPARPWFRLPTVGRQPPAAPPAPAPAPAPVPQPQPPQPQAPQQPRIPVIRPAFRPAFAQPQSAPPPPPSAPPTQPPSPPSPPPPYPITSPSPPPSRPSPPPVIPSPPTSIASPKIVEPESPIKATRSPPPISLPPPQLEPRSLPEAEQEKVLLQDTFNKKVVFPASDREGNTKHGRHKEARKKAPSDSEDGKSVSIITMTGDNKGALMELDFPSRRNNAGNDSGESDGGNADRSKSKDRERMAAQPRVPMSGYVNSNVQSINNSILYRCSFSHHDPGVHFSLSRKPLHRKDGGNGHGIHHPNGKQA